MVKCIIVKRFETAGFCELSSVLTMETSPSLLVSAIALEQSAAVSGTLLISSYLFVGRVEWTSHPFQKKYKVATDVKLHAKNSFNESLCTQNGPKRIIKNLHRKISPFLALITLEILFIESYTCFPNKHILPRPPPPFCFSRLVPVFLESLAG